MALSDSGGATSRHPDVARPLAGDMYFGISGNRDRREVYMLDVHQSQTTRYQPDAVR